MENPLITDLTLLYGKLAKQQAKAEEAGAAQEADALRLKKERAKTTLDTLTQKAIKDWIANTSAQEKLGQAQEKVQAAIEALGKRKQLAQNIVNALGKVDEALNAIVEVIGVL